MKHKLGNKQVVIECTTRRLSAILRLILVSADTYLRRVADSWLLYSAVATRLKLALTLDRPRLQT